ncbi:MAG: gamma-glutamyltransferase [Leptospira sp.]|nr:gamma-glutamyltransferase [Leptospira sp.]
MKIFSYSFAVFISVILFHSLSLNCFLFESKKIAIGSKFAIATDHPLASQAGIDMYKNGGNMIDSFVASSFVLAVVRPQSTGLGGGGFALIRWNDTGETFALDFRERAPALANENMYLDKDGKVIDKLSMFGYKSIAIPGLVKGILELHKKYGSLTREEVLLPAKRLAEEGFTVYPNLEESIHGSAEEMNPAMKKIFMPNGVLLKSGDVLVQKDLANTIQKIISNGSDEFYKLSTADKIQKAMLGNDGLISKKDLADYKAIQRTPISIKYRDTEIIGFPPPSSAVFLFQILKSLEHKDLQQLKEEEKFSFYKYFIEAMGLGFEDRAIFGGDPDFTDVNVSQLLSEKNIVSKQKLIDKTVQSRISKQLPKSEDSKIPKTLESYNTTHISITDDKGNSISSTHSINYTFGSRVVIPNTGIIMNDTMDDFVVSPNQPNAYGLVGGKSNSIQPNKTPLSSMSPTIVVKDGKNWLNLGAPGGSFIVTSILNTLINRIDFDLSAYESVSNPRVHYQFKPDLVFLEEEMDPEFRILEDYGYNLKFTPNRGKVFYTEVRGDGKIIAVSDPRGQGNPMAE